MEELFYRWITFLSRRYGLWIFRIYKWIVATGFFLLVPSRVKTGIRFYRVLFPHKDILGCLGCVWRQYHHFTNIFLDRFILEQWDSISDHSGKREASITYTSHGWEHIEQAFRDKTGGIILMSHMGNWEMAAHIFKQKNRKIPLMLYMGIKNKERMEHIQKRSLSGQGVEIVGVEAQNATPFDIIQGLDFLKKGGLVSMTGDRLWHNHQKSVPVEFLGHEVRFPQTPYLFSMLSGVPLFVFFAFRTGEGKYHFEITRLDPVLKKRGAQRNAVVEKSARQYAFVLEKALYRYPFQWGHFGSFLCKKF